MKNLAYYINKSKTFVLFYILLNSSIIFSMSSNNQKDQAIHIIDIKYMRTDWIVNNIRQMQKHNKSIRNAKISDISTGTQEFFEPKIMVADEKESVEKISNII